MHSLKYVLAFLGFLLIFVEIGSADSLTNSSSNSTTEIQETLAIFGRKLKAIFCGDVDTHPEDTLDEKQKRTLIALIMIPAAVLVLLMISCCICGWQVFCHKSYAIYGPLEETMHHPYSTLETATDASTTMHPHLIGHRVVDENRTSI